MAIAAACQFTTPEPGSTELAWQPNLAELAAGLGLAEADLQAAISTIRRTPQDQMPRIRDVVRRVAETFSEIGQERLNLLGRLEKIAEMSRI